MASSFHRYFLLLSYALSLVAGTSGLAASLTGAKSAQPVSLDLSLEGATDWTHWGLNSSTEFNHKSGVTSSVSNISKIGTGTISRYTDGTMGVSWSGGTPVASASNTKTGIYVAGVGNGFQITAPADTATRTLKIYCGVWKSQGKLEATLSDSSAPSFVDTSHGSTTGSSNTSFTLQYAAASAGQTLTVKWTVQTSHDTSGSGTVGWQAASLATSSTTDPCAGNSSPTVSISSPVNGTSFTAPASVIVSANAADANGSVTKVEFFQGTSILGTDTTSPYTISWNGVAAGSYQLSARATDNCNASTTSSAVSITVNSSSSTTTTTPTTVTLSPTADTYVRDGTYATSTFGTSSILQTKLGTSGYTRHAYLKFDLSSVSGSISSAKLRVYGKYSSTSGASATQACSVSDDAWTESGMTWNNKPVIGASQASVTITSMTAQYYEWDVTSYISSEKAASQTLASIALTHTVSCTGNNDFNSREAASNKPQLVIVTSGGGGANNPPAVSLTSPANGATFTSPANIPMSATATDSDGSVKDVVFFAGSSVLGADSTSPYALTWSSVSSGSFSLTARATDNAAATKTSAAINITVSGSSSSGPVWNHEVQMVHTGRNKTNYARLWYPSGKIKGFLMCGSISNASQVATHSGIRATLAANELGIVWTSSREFGMSSFNPAFGDDVFLLQMLKRLSEVSGKPEVQHAPWIVFGHSTDGLFCKNVACWKPERTFGILYYKSGNIDNSSNLHFPPLSKIANVPFLAINGRYEEHGPNGPLQPGQSRETQWWAVRDTLMNLRKEHFLVSMLVEHYGLATHGSWANESAVYMAKFIDKAAKAKLPNLYPTTGPVTLNTIDETQGWLTCECLTSLMDSSTINWSPVEASYANWPATGRGDAFWHFDRTIAIDWINYHRGSKSQYQP